MRLIIILFLLSFLNVSAFSQSTVFDDFSKKDISSWIWGGLEIKYSHDYDNKENGYLEIFSKAPLKAGSYIGKAVKYSPMLFTAGNYINLMVQGVNNDVTMKVELLYDIDNNAKYNDDKDIMLTSKPISLNYSGWKEVKIKIDEENLKLISKFNDDFSVTEEAVLGIQFEFEAGSEYKESKFESGLALISEIASKDNLTSNENTSSNTKNSGERETYFNAKNYPNPFNPTTTINYTLNESGNVKLTVYDRLGREVQTLVDENQSSGTHTVEFNASSLPSGIYFYRIKSNDRTEVFKMILAK